MFQRRRHLAQQRAEFLFERGLQAGVLPLQVLLELLGQLMQRIGPQGGRESLQGMDQPDGLLELLLLQGRVQLRGG